MGYTLNLVRGPYMYTIYNVGFTAYSYAGSLSRRLAPVESHQTSNDDVGTSPIVAQSPSAAQLYHLKHALVLIFCTRKFSDTKPFHGCTSLCTCTYVCVSTKPFTGAKVCVHVRMYVFPALFDSLACPYRVYTV